MSTTSALANGKNSSSQENSSQGGVRLCHTQVRQLKCSINSQPEKSYRQFALELGVTEQTIKSIAAGYTWRGVGPDVIQRKTGRKAGSIVPPTRCLTPDQIDEVRAAHAERKASYAILARQYGVCRTTIHNYCRGVRKLEPKT